jgi:hypothetical protein
MLSSYGSAGFNLYRAPTTGIVLAFSSTTRTDAFHFFACPMPQWISHRLGSRTYGRSKTSVYRTGLVSLTLV